MLTIKHLQGEEAKNVPGESVTEDHYMDQDGNLVSRKVTYSSSPLWLSDKLKFLEYDFTRFVTVL